MVTLVYGQYDPGYEPENICTKYNTELLKMVSLGQACGEDIVHWLDLGYKIAGISD
jgi:hypothetical protein